MDGWMGGWVDGLMDVRSFLNALQTPTPVTFRRFARGFHSVAKQASFDGRSGSLFEPFWEGLGSQNGRQNRFLRVFFSMFFSNAFWLRFFADFFRFFEVRTLIFVRTASVS